MAEESLISSSWYRVAELKPRLRAHARIHRHVYRGQDWYVLQDESSGRFHRFSAEAYYVIGLLDGRRTMGQIIRSGEDWTLTNGRTPVLEVSETARTLVVLRDGEEIDRRVIVLRADRVEVVR